MASRTSLRATYVSIFSSAECYCCEAKKVEEHAEEMDRGSTETTPAAKQSLTAAEAFIQRQMQVAEAKEQIASLCTAVISSPEDNVMIFSRFVKYN